MRLWDMRALGLVRGLLGGEEETGVALSAGVRLSTVGETVGRALRLSWPYSR